MSDALPDPPQLEPGALSGASFSRSRKGFEPTEVRSLLGRAADAMRVWALRDEQLTVELAALQERLASAEHLDEAKVTELLGAETARIVATARAAAAEIREHAEADAAALRERTEAELRETSERLLAEATGDREAAAVLRTEAEAHAASTIESATAESRRLVEEARGTADSMLAEAARSAEERTTTATAEAERTLAEAGRQHDEMTAAAAAVLADRTAEAEAAAEEVRRTAEGVLESARAEAARVGEDAATAAAATLEQARDEARAMLEETRGLRHRMLRDLADRRRALRQQLEAARAARAGVLEAIRTASSRLDDAVGELDRSESEVQRSADAAASSIPDDVALVAAELEAELDEGRRADADEAGALDHAPDSGVPGEDTVAEPVAGAAAGGEHGAAEPDADADGGGDGGAVTEPGTEPDAGADAVEEAAAGSGGPGAPEAPAGSAGEQLASVHDLFERLRSTTSEETPAAHPSGGPTGAMVAEAGGAAVTVIAGQPAEVVPASEVPDADTVLLDRRDELLASADRLMARSLKRLVGDEQNEVLDKARRIRKGRVDLDDLFPADATERFVEGLSEAFREAAAAGTAMWCELTGDPAPTLAVATVESALAAQVRELEELRRVQLRATLEQLDESGEDLAVLVDHLRAAYREMRSVSVPHQAADLTIAGFTTGTVAAAPAGASWRWVPDNAGQPCADAEDNALAGVVGCGEAFPTGDRQPPAHPGCRCILVPPR